MDGPLWSKHNVDCATLAQQDSTLLYVWEDRLDFDISFSNSKISSAFSEPGTPEAWGSGGSSDLEKRMK